MISEIIEKWIKGILIDGITGNLSGLFDNVNAKVGEIASDVGSTPQAWNSGIFNMLRSLSETVVLPIAAAILALVMCHELIQMITEKNNMHDFDTSMFFRWIFNASTIKQPTYYDIPPEALKDDRFAAMMEEATKYIGYPYVWGGSSPSTSFDCSGYISWVLNHSGWNVGRQTAQGLYNLCTPVSAAQVKPGDLVFFKGTYDTPGVSHCGIYVGNSIMLHCGDPMGRLNGNTRLLNLTVYRIALEKKWGCGRFLSRS